MCLPQSILQREGIRQLPGICQYPAKGTANAVKQGGTADRSYSSLTELVLSGTFFVVRQKRIKGVCQVTSTDKSHYAERPSSS